MYKALVVNVNYANMYKDVFWILNIFIQLYNRIKLISIFSLKLYVTQSNHFSNAQIPQKPQHYVKALKT